MAFSPRQTLRALRWLTLSTEHVCRSTIDATASSLALFLVASCLCSWVGAIAPELNLDLTDEGSLAVSIPWAGVAPREELACDRGPGVNLKPGGLGHVVGFRGMEDTGIMWSPSRGP